MVQSLSLRARARVRGTRRLFHPRLIAEASDGVHTAERAPEVAALLYPDIAAEGATAACGVRGCAEVGALPLRSRGLSPSANPPRRAHLRVRVSFHVHAVALQQVLRHDQRRLAHPF